MWPYVAFLHTFVDVLYVPYPWWVLFLLNRITLICRMKWKLHRHRWFTPPFFAPQILEWSSSLLKLVYVKLPSLCMVLQKKFSLLLNWRIPQSVYQHVQNSSETEVLHNSFFISYYILEYSVCLIMEYLENGSLLDYLRSFSEMQPRFSVMQTEKDSPMITSKQLMRFGLEIANGMEYLALKNVRNQLIRLTVWVILVCLCPLLSIIHGTFFL